MLNIKFRYDSDEDGHPLQALCPWIDFITPGLVLNKDGSILAAFDYTGVDPDDLYDEQVDSITKHMQRVYERFDSRITAWWIVDKRRDHTYAQGEFQNETAAELDKLYSVGFTAGKHFSIRYTLYLLYTGGTGANKFLDRVTRIQQETGNSVPSSFFSAIKESLSTGKDFARDKGTTRENIAAFERIIETFTTTAPLRLKRLIGDDFTSALSALLNRADHDTYRKKPAKRALLDAWLPMNYMTCGPDVLRFEGNSKQLFAGVLGMARWPDETTPMLFEGLAKMDLEFTICQIVRFLDVAESAETINKAIEYYELTQYGLISHAVAKASSQTPEVKPGRGQLLDECKDAREQLGADGITFAYHNMSIFVYGGSRDEVKRNCNLVTTNLSTLHFTVIRERQNAGPSFAAMLPGQWSQQSRYELLSIDNVANVTPIYTMQEGSRLHDFFSTRIYNRPVPALAVFGNTYGGRFNFTPHVDQVGHMIIIAPTGGGKSTFVNFCLSQFQRYGKVNTFVFDRNMSCKVVTKLHDGTYINIKGSPVRWNPFSVMMPNKDGTPSKEGKLWVREFILRRLAEGGLQATADDRMELDEKLGMMERSFIKNKEPMSMTALCTQLSVRLKDELSEWLAGRPYGMFDNEEDDFSLGNWTTIELSSIMSVDRLARAFMDYAFRKVYDALDGTPTMIYLEEASFLLNDTRFGSMIDEWAKTLRSRNAFLWMTIQSPQSVTNSEMATTILDNFPNFLLLANPKIEQHREAYKKNFALADHQVDMIANLQPKRDYLLVQAENTRVMTTDFSKETLAYLRSEKTVLNIFEKYENDPNPSGDWKRRYLDEVART